MKNAMVFRINRPAVMRVMVALVTPEDQERLRTHDRVTYTLGEMGEGLCRPRYVLDLWTNPTRFREKMLLWEESSQLWKYDALDLLYPMAVAGEHRRAA